MFQKTICTATAALLIASLAACGTKTPAPETTVPSTTLPVTEATTEATLPPVVFEETVIVDNENCTFTITAIDSESTWGYTLKAYLENKTDKELMFSLDNVSVNGFMCDPFWAVTVSAGMKANEEIRFSPEDFDNNGIDSVTDITFTLNVYDSNNWDADHLVADTFTIYPLGAEAVVHYEREAQEGDIVLFENENCTMIVTGFDPDSIWGYAVHVYLENKTDKNLMFSIDGAAVNGFMCDPLWAETVAAGKRSNTAITWYTSALEENGITDVESLVLPLRVYDADNWMAEDLVDETFTITP